MEIAKGSTQQSSTNRAEGLDESGSIPDSAGKLIGRSPAFVEFLRQLDKLARSNAPVLIEGDTGVGKELAARAIHYLGSRSQRPFVPVNCGAIPDNLVESELFGHARGAFTDAKQARIGLIAQANNGTLFLDEIETLSAKAQTTLLRFLQDHRYRPLGHSREEVCDARIIAATNLELGHMVRDGQFRGDLMYRLNILALRVPALRERTEDIALLARHFLRRYCAQYGLATKHLHPSTLRWMEQYAWPGNVRELENFLHRQVLLGDGDEILCPAIQDTTDKAECAATANFRTAKAQAIALFERRYLGNLLEQTGGNITAAARLAGKERRAFAKLAKKHGIDRGHYLR
jgi:DNA-binding NtrC family response regulator